MVELWKWTAVDLAQVIRRGEVSSLAAVGACLDRLAAVNPRLNAVVRVLAYEALEAAEAADAAVRRKEDLGPLHGVPVTIEDNVDQAGLPRTDGVVALKDNVSAEDRPVVANWRRTDRARGRRAGMGGRHPVGIPRVAGAGGVGSRAACASYGRGGGAPGRRRLAGRRLCGGGGRAALHRGSGGALGRPRRGGYPQPRLAMGGLLL